MIPLSKNESAELIAKFDIMVQQLSTERASFMREWRDINDYIKIRGARFVASNVNRGEGRTRFILDSSATEDLSTLAAGMSSGMTTQLRPWFKLRHAEDEFAELESVKRYYHVFTRRLRHFFSRTNFYNTMGATYSGAGAFGTHAIFMEKVPKDKKINYRSIPLGSYYIATGPDGMVNTFVREISMSVRQIIEKFGREHAGEEIMRQAKEGGLDNRFVVTHAIVPNNDYDQFSALSNKKKFTSIYYQEATESRGTASRTGQQNAKAGRQVFSIGGYDKFPVLCVRWYRDDGDDYGTDCPGMMALPDVKQLQFQERMIAKAVAKKVSPPTIGPSNLLKEGLRSGPDDHNFYDGTGDPKGLRALYEVDFDIAAMEKKQDGCRSRIGRKFYVPYFLAMLSSDRRQITAREVDERHAEKSQVLGPVLEQLTQDLFGPAIEYAVDYMSEIGEAPEPPEEILGREYNIQYVSVMALAQLAGHLANLERFSGFVADLAANEMKLKGTSEAMDKVDQDELIEEYGDLTGIKPTIIRNSDKVAALREQRAAEAEQQAAAQNAETQSKSLKNLAEAGKAAEGLELPGNPGALDQAAAPLDVFEDAG